MYQALHLVHPLVHGGEEGVVGLGGEVAAGGPDGEGELVGALVLGGPALKLHQHGLLDLVHKGKVAAIAEHHELVTREAYDQRPLGHCPGDDVGRVGQGAVAHRMAKAVVYGLEGVDVDHQAPCGLAALAELRQLLVKVAAVEELCKGVKVGELVLLAHVHTDEAKSRGAPARGNAVDNGLHRGPDEDGRQEHPDGEKLGLPVAADEPLPQDDAEYQVAKGGQVEGVAHGLSVIDVFGVDAENKVQRQVEQQQGVGDERGYAEPAVELPYAVGAVVEPDVGVKAPQEGHGDVCKEQVAVAKVGQRPLSRKAAAVDDVGGHLYQAGRGRQQDKHVVEPVLVPAAQP